MGYLPTTANAHLGLMDTTNTLEIPLMLKKARDDKGNELPATLAETLTAAVADSPLADWLEPSVREDWSRGVGLDYNDAPGVTTRVARHAIPAGAATSITIPAANNSLSPLIAIEEFGGDLFIAQEGLAGQANSARVIRSVGGGTVFADSLNLGAGRILRDLVLFNDKLYAFSTNASALVGEVHSWNGAAWSASSATLGGGVGAGGVGTGRVRTVKVNWRTEDGTVGDRLVSVCGPRDVAYTRVGADPQLQASWVDPAVTIGTGFVLTDIAAARHHVWFGTRDGVFDLDALGEAPNLLGYEVHAIAAGFPYPTQYLNGYVYISLGYQLDRVFVGNPGQLQEVSESCAPGLDTPTENEWHGYVTAMCSDQGWLVCAVYNPVTLKTGIFWGKDRSTLRIDSPNPLVWHGPEVHSIPNYRVTKMRSSALGVGQKLWICSVTPGLAPALDAVSLPMLGSSLDDLVSNGYHAFATGVAGASPWQRFCSLRSLGETGGDKGSAKIPFHLTYGTRGVGGATKLTTYTGADFLPGAPVWGVGLDVTTGPTASIAPGVISGKKLYSRVDFFSPNGGASPPTVAVLDALRWEWWRTVTTFRVLHLDVEYGTNVSDLQGGVDDATAPDHAADGSSDTTTRLKALTEAPPTALRLPDDSRWLVKLRQVLDVVTTPTVGAGSAKVQARLQVALVARLS